MSNVFSVPLFFITFRETLEAAIIISVLLSLVENLFDKTTIESVSSSSSSDETKITVEGEETPDQRRKRLIRRMKIQIWAGAGTGLLISLCIGAAFIAVFFTSLGDIWAKTESIWEGTFSLVACAIIFIMGLTMLRIDRSKIKWRLKLEHAFDTKGTGEAQSQQRGGKWTLFLIPLITVLREGLEAVVFVGGVSLGQPATSIPLAAITGIGCGLIVGYLIYASSSRVNLSIFLVVSTNVLFLLGAGLFSKGVAGFNQNAFNTLVGAGDIGELGAGPGSYNVVGSVWQLSYGNPNNPNEGQGWAIFKAVFGWTNSASVASIVSYCLYWVAVIVALFYMKWSEGRFTFFGKRSAAGERRISRLAAKQEAASDTTSTIGDEKALKGVSSIEQDLAPVLLK